MSKNEKVEQRTASYTDVASIVKGPKWKTLFILLAVLAIFEIVCVLIPPIRDAKTILSEA